MVSVTPADTAERLRDSRFCEPRASPPGCLPMASAEPLAAPPAKVVKKSWNPNWVTVTNNTSAEKTTDSSRSNVNTVPNAQTSTAPAQVKPVVQNTTQPSDADAEREFDSLFERECMKEAQIEDDNLSIVMAYCDAGKKPDHNELRTLPEKAKKLLLQWDSCLLYTSPSPRD